METTTLSTEAPWLGYGAGILGSIAVAIISPQPALAEQSPSQISQAPRQNTSVMSGLKTVELKVPVLNSDGKIDGYLPANHCVPGGNTINNRGIEAIMSNSDKKVVYRCLPIPQEILLLNPGDLKATDTIPALPEQSFEVAKNVPKYQQVSIVAGKNEKTTFNPLNTFCSTKNKTPGIPVIQNTYSGDNRIRQSKFCIQLPTK